MLLSESDFKDVVDSYRDLNRKRLSLDDLIKAGIAQFFQQSSGLYIGKFPEILVEKEILAYLEDKDGKLNEEGEIQYRNLTEGDCLAMIQKSLQSHLRGLRMQKGINSKRFFDSKGKELVRWIYDPKLNHEVWYVRPVN